MNETLETFTERLRKEADVETLRIDGSGRVRIPLPRKAILNPHFIVGGKDVPGRGRVTPGRDLLEDYLLVRPKLGDGPGFSFEEIRHLLSLRTRVKHDPELRAAIHTFLGWSRPMSVNNSVKIIELGIPHQDSRLGAPGVAPKQGSAPFGGSDLFQGGVLLPWACGDHLPRAQGAACGVSGSVK